MTFDDECAPLSEEEARRAAQPVLDLPGADAVEVVVTASYSGVTRYAGSEIIQNTVRELANAYVRVAAQGRSATSTTNQLDAGHMREAASKALEAANASPADPRWAGLPTLEDAGKPEPVLRFDADTARATPGERAAAIGAIISASDSDNAAGIYETGSHVYSVFSSEGIDCYDSFSRAVVTCLVDNGEATGWGESSSHRMSDVDHEAAARAAARKAGMARKATDADPGTYEVVLEPSAVGVLMEYLAYAGFGAKQVLEGDSFLCSRTGQDVAPPSVTVADDVRHPCSVGIGFDFEGVSKKRVAVIDKGRATGPVTDMRTGRELGDGSTGHFSGSAEFGPYAANVVLEPGEAALEDLIGAVSNGVLVSRFHYVNILDRPATLLTGMTRDGTFRIRDGEIAEPIHNFRFTQSVLDCLSSVEGVGRDALALAPEFGSFGSVVAPALRAGAFRFTSRTSH